MFLVSFTAVYARKRLMLLVLRFLQVGMLLKGGSGALFHHFISLIETYESLEMPTPCPLYCLLRKGIEFHFNVMV